MIDIRQEPYPLKGDGLANNRKVVSRASHLTRLSSSNRATFGAKQRADGYRYCYLRAAFFPPTRL